MLISTRIAGLLPRRACTEIHLSLMSKKEAVEMLGEAQVVLITCLCECNSADCLVHIYDAAHGSGHDNKAVSPSFCEVARLCGYLPLCLNIAGTLF